MKEEVFDMQVTKDQLDLLEFALTFCVGKWRLMDLFVPRSLVEEVMGSIRECRGRMATAERLTKEEE